jgi:hypothetical protein
MGHPGEARRDQGRLAVVPESGGVGANWDGIDSAHTGSLATGVADGTRDVTITGTGPAGNA